MKKVQWIIVLALLTVACAKPQVVVPADVINRDTMVVILSEMHLVEATIQLKGLGRNDTLKQEAYGRYRYIFDEHKLTTEKFRKSLEYYRSEPDYFHKMYDDVLTRLSVEQAKSKK